MKTLAILVCSAIGTFFALAGNTAAFSTGYTTLQLVQTGAILNVIINNTESDVNLMSEIVYFELDNLVTNLQNDTSTKVVIFKSGNPTFFIAHYDVLSRQGDPVPPTDPSLVLLASNVFFNITQLPQATLAIIEGPARDVGNEFLFSCDMRFASKEAIFGNFEVSLGLLPGTGGALYMPLLIGRGRAFEYLLSGQDIDAKTAERVGWVNRAFDSPSELDNYVNNLAERIALFPLDGLANTKSSVNSITRPTPEQLALEASAYNRLSASPQAQQLVEKFLVLTKNETDVQVELDVGNEVVNLYQ